VKPLLTEAPFGKGTVTVVDKEVRNALEIPKANLTIDGLTEWNTVLNKAVAEAAQKLAPTLSTYDVTAELYKLVVYEEGGMFKAHRDTQRSETHFGTLVILLPGKATGGELIVRHGGDEETFSIPTGKKRCTWVAYFADVEHEVLPVTKGRRISLLYHLNRSAKSAGVKTPAPTPVAASSSSSKGKGAQTAAVPLPPIIARAKELAALLKGEEEEKEEEKPAKKQKIDEKGKGKGKGKAVVTNDDDDDDDGDDGDDEEKPPPKFLAFMCEHAYAGELKPEKLKDTDAAFHSLFAPHFPGTRLAQIEIHAYGPCYSDEGQWIKNPGDLNGYIVEVDEIEGKTHAAKKGGEKEKGSWFRSEYKFHSGEVTSRLLCYATKGSLDDYDPEFPNCKNPVRFLNDDGDLPKCATRTRAADKRTQGTGNEGSSGAFLYKRAAILVPLVPDAEASLGKFSAAHASRSHPDFLP